MKKQISLLFFVFLILSFQTIAQKAETFILKSGDGNIVLHVEADNRLQWSFQHKGEQVIAPSPIFMNIGGEILPSDISSL